MSNPARTRIGLAPSPGAAGAGPDSRLPSAFAGADVHPSSHPACGASMRSATVLGAINNTRELPMRRLGTPFQASTIFLPSPPPPFVPVHGLRVLRRVRSPHDIHRRRSHRSLLSVSSSDCCVQAFIIVNSLVMESREDIEGSSMLQTTMPLGPIDPKRARFPCCIVWAPLPLISWFIPFIGHVGICREDGVILDFAGPNFVCVDHFTFGSATRYIQLERKKVIAQGDLGQTISGEESTWDFALKKSTQEFQHRSYNLFTCNCHSFVANNLNRLCYGGHDNWNVVNLAVWIFIRGTWVNKRAIAKSLLPFLVVLVAGTVLGGSLFLTGLLLFALLLVSWFLLGTYCFKNLIQL